MALDEAIAVAVIGIVVIEGIWLAALTYLMWRRRRREAMQPPKAPEEGTTGST